MKNYIKKINFYHSFLFFLFTNLFVIIIDQNKNLNISTIICLILILTIGVSHGSLDNIKGKDKHGKNEIRETSQKNGG